MQWMTSSNRNIWNKKRNFLTNDNPGALDKTQPLQNIVPYLQHVTAYGHYMPENRRLMPELTAPVTSMCCISVLRPQANG